MYMKLLSFWAKGHKAAARILIIVGFLFLNIAGVFTGDLLNSMNVLLRPLFCVIAMMIFIFGMIIYPSKKNKQKYINFYFRQKSTDGLLIFSTFLIFIFLGNSINENRIRIYQPVYGISIIPKSPDVAANTLVSIAIHKSLLSKKIVRKNFYKKLQAFRKQYKNSTSTGKTLLIILTILISFGLIILLMGLSCNIACSGADGLAIVVLFVGLSGIIFGMLKILQRIKRGKTQQHKAKGEEQKIQTPVP